MCSFFEYSSDVIHSESMDNCPEPSIQITVDGTFEKLYFPRN